MLSFCPNCNAALPERFFRRVQVDGSCPTCATSLTLTLFPALFRPRTAIDVQSLSASEGEASCYEHAGKKAVALCNQCGRFLCALCEVEIDGKVWCPGCLLPGGSAVKPIQAIEKHRTLYDSIALALATFPAMLFFYPSIFTAPVVVYLAIRYWRRPSSIIPRSKWRFVVALVIVLIEFALIFALIVGVAMFTQTRNASQPQ